MAFYYIEKDGKTCVEYDSEGEFLRINGESISKPKNLERMFAGILTRTGIYTKTRRLGGMCIPMISNGQNTEE